MRDGSVHGNGLTLEFEAKGGWSKIRDAGYPGFFENDDDDPDRGYAEVFRGPLGEKGYEDEAGAAEPARDDGHVVSSDAEGSPGQGSRKGDRKAPTKARQPKDGGQR